MKTKKKIFKVKIEEVYEKTYEVLAENVEEANDIISGADITMENNNYKEDSFRIVSTNETDETLDSLISMISKEQKECSEIINDPLTSENVSKIQMFWFSSDRLKNLLGWKE